MNLICRSLTASAAVLAATIALAAPAFAATNNGRGATSVIANAHPLAPIPGCGNHFFFSRSGSTVRVAGTDLGAFSSGYMLVYASAKGTAHGPYNASPTSRANFSFSTGSSSKATIAIDLTNDSNTQTLCSSDYTV
ncbi:hypothetical protein [Streptomyces sp. 8L]|uniref:hypothetical protein n=1 Tax=Streptomyces sp. 8L TaxID=2877242 RepID=UPI001CD51DB0|nr:hypothetical protein [Streptomyces sp. 8L]MCA1221889.1 hypothetical protein [Streptomyces sp. 8L]